MLWRGLGWGGRGEKIKSFIQLLALRKDLARRVRVSGLRKGDRARFHTAITCRCRIDLHMDRRSDHVNCQISRTMNPIVPNTHAFLFSLSLNIFPFSF